MMKPIYLSFFLFLTLHSAIAAEPKGSEFEISFIAGPTIPIGSDTFQNQTSTNLGAGIELSYFFIPNFGFGIGYNRLEFSGTPLSVDAFQASLLYRGASSSFRPIVGIGAGADTVKLFVGSDRTYTNFAMNILAAGEFDLGPFWRMQLGLKYHYVKTGTGSPHEVHVLLPFLGLAYSFGGRSQASSSIEEISPTDVDRDGVADYMDQCPNSILGEKVNASGCALSENVEIKLNLQFRTGQSEILPEFRPELEKIAQEINRYPDAQVMIEGHTDNQGNEVKNKELSQARANAVRDELIQNFDILPQRIDAVGYGSERPIATNSTAAGRQKNRRVVAIIRAK